MLSRDQRQIMAAAKISKLLLLRIMGELSESDWEVLNAWISRQDEDTLAYIEQITQQAWIESDLMDFVCIDVQAAFEDVQKRLGQSD